MNKEILNYYKEGYMILMIGGTLHTDCKDFNGDIEILVIRNLEAIVRV